MYNNNVVNDYWRFKMNNLKKYNEILAEVRKVNQGISAYGARYIASQIFKTLEKTPDFAKLKAEFWELNKKAKRITSATRRCEKSHYLEKMIEIAKIFVKNNNVDNFFGKFSDWVRNVAEAYVFDGKKYLGYFKYSN